ncbi:MAG: hypothetical protein R6X12_01300 [bacterium]
MQSAFLLAALAAFEAGLPFGSAAAMLAGGAHPDWRSALSHNPALAVAAPRLAAATGYWRPHGLEGVDHFGLGGAASFERWSCVAGASQLGYDRFRERDFGLAGAFRPAAGWSVGAAAHLLTVTAGTERTEAAVALDAGVTWAGRRLRVGAAGGRVNAPRFAGGDELPATVRAGFAAEPFDDLTAALDVGWSVADPEVALGLELRLLPQLALRCGGRWPPLGYSAGLGFAAGPVGVDYALRYHAQLRDSHIFGLRVQCW